MQKARHVGVQILNTPTGALRDVSEQDVKGQGPAGVGLTVQLCSGAAAAPNPAGHSAGSAGPRVPLRLAPTRTAGSSAAVPTAADPNPVGTAAVAKPPHSRSCSAAVSAENPEAPHGLRQKHAQNE